MHSEVIARLLRGAFANGYGQLVTIVTQLISVPLLLSCWGVDLYGEWLVLSAIPVYLSLSDLGFGAGAANAMTMLVAKGQRQSALAVFQSVFVLTGFISIALAILLLSAVGYIPLGSWFQFDKLGYADVIQVILLLGFHVLLGLQLSMLEAGFRCEGNYAKGTFFLATLRLLEFFGMFVTVLLGGGVVAAAAILIGVRVAGIFVLRIILFKLSPWIVYGYSNATVKEIKQLASPALSFMAFPLGNALSMQGMVLVIGAVLGPAAVVVFSVTRTISRIALQAMGLINSSVWPELSVAFGKEDFELVRKLHRTSCQLSFWLSTAVIILLLVSGGALIRIWTHGKVEIDYELFCLMMMVIFANSFWYTSSVVHAASNRHQIMAGLYILGTSVSLLLATFLVSIFALNGAAIALLAVDFFMIYFVVKTSMALTQDDFWSFIKQLFSIAEIMEALKRRYEKR